MYIIKSVNLYLSRHGGFLLNVTIFDFLRLFAIIIIEKQMAADRRSARKIENQLTKVTTVKVCKALGGRYRFLQQSLPRA